MHTMADGQQEDQIGRSTVESQAVVVEQIHPSAARYCDDQPCACLVAWLNVEATRLVRPGARAIVVGCGFGHNVCELESRGYDAEGFDNSPVVVELARSRHPKISDRIFAADLLDPPTPHLARHDLVVDVETLNFIDHDRRERAVYSLAALAKPHGIVIVIANRENDRTALYGLGADELIQMMDRHGFEPIRPPDEYDDDNSPPRARIRASFRRR